MELYNYNIFHDISRAAVMTGRYQMRSGFYPKGLDPGDIGGVSLITSNNY